MMTRSVRRTAATLSVPLLLFVGSIGIVGCDDNSDSSAPNDTKSTTDVDTPTESSGAATSSSEPTDSTDPTTEPADSTGATSGSPPPTTHDNSSTRRARASQVAKEDLPGFNDQWSWDSTRVTNTAPGNGPAMSRCSHSSLTAIGGVAEYTTTYLSNASKYDQARLTVAVFPDEKTATMAASVLDTWLAGCRAWLGQRNAVDRIKVTADTPVSTSVGTAHSRVASFGPVPGDPDSTYFNGEGYVRDGDVISYLVVHSIGQDYNYEQGQEPAALGLQVAADALKASR